MSTARISVKADGDSVANLCIWYVQCAYYSTETVKETVKDSAIKSQNRGWLMCCCSFSPKFRHALGTVFFFPVFIVAFYFSSWTSWKVSRFKPIAISFTVLKFSNIFKFFKIFFYLLFFFSILFRFCFINFLHCYIRLLVLHMLLFFRRGTLKSVGLPWR